MSKGPDQMNNEAVKNRLRNMSSHDLKAIGINSICYIRPLLNNTVEEFGLYAADGELICANNSRERLIGIAHNNNLETVLLQ
jgi:hypothetical protein